MYCTFIVKYITQLLWKKCVLQVQTANLVLLPLWSCSGTELCFWTSVCRSAMTGVRVLKIIIPPQQRPIFSYIYHRLFFHYFLMGTTLKVVYYSYNIMWFFGMQESEVKGKPRMGTNSRKWGWFVVATRRLDEYLCVYGGHLPL